MIRVKWADPSVHEAHLIRKYCPSLADKVEAAGAYRLDDVDATKEELRQFRSGLGLPDLDQQPWWRRLFRNEFRRGDQQL